MAAGDILEIVLRGAGSGGAVYNVLHFRDEGGDGDVPNLIETAVQALMSTSAGVGIDNMLAETQYNLAEVSWQVISPVLGALNVYSLAANRTGEQSTPGHHVTCAVITWLTALGGRSKRGRTFFGPLAEAVVTDGVITTAFLAILNAACDAFTALYAVGGTETANYTFGVWSRTLTSFEPVISAICRTLARTQRRRQIGVGA